MLYSPKIHFLNPCLKRVPKTGIIASPIHPKKKKSIKYILQKKKHLNSIALIHVENV